MSTRRLEKLSSLYAQVISNWLKRNVFFENTIIALTQVSVSEDLKALDIYVSVWPDEREGDVLESLEHLKRELRGHIAEKVKTKFVPKLHFVLDVTEKSRMKIENILKQENN